MCVQWRVRNRLFFISRRTIRLKIMVRYEYKKRTRYSCEKILKNKFGKKMLEKEF